MQVDDGVLQLHVSEQHLNGAQIRSGFEHMRRIAVAKQMRGDAFLDPGVLGRFLAGLPDVFVVIGTSARQPFSIAGEQPRLRLHPAPVLTECFKQFPAQWHIPVASAFAVTDVDDVALAVDVADLQSGTSRPGACLSSRAVIRIARWFRLLAASISR